MFLKIDWLFTVLKSSIVQKQNQSCEDNKISVHGVSEGYSKAAKIVKKQYSYYSNNI